MRWGIVLVWIGGMVYVPVSALGLAMARSIQFGHCARVTLGWADAGLALLWIALGAVLVVLAMYGVEMDVRERERRRESRTRPRIQTRPATGGKNNVTSIREWRRRGGDEPPAA